MNKQRIKYVVVPLLLLAGLAVAGKFAMSSGTKETLVKENSITITTATASMQNRQPKLTLSGSIEGETSGIIAAKFGGRIAEVLVEDGTRVQAGQPLLRLESAELANALRSAEEGVRRAQAGYDNAEAEYNRYQTLYNEKAIPLQQLEGVATRMKTAQADLASAYASLGTAREQYKDAVVVAPVDGVTANKSAVVGQVVAAGAQLMTVEKLSQVYAVVNVEQKDMGIITEGMKAEVQVDAYPDKVFSGTVEIVNPAAASTNRLFRVKIKVDNPERKLKPGMFVKVSIITGEEKAALFVPQSCVFQKQGVYYVYVQQDGRVKRQRVEAGAVSQDFIEIKSGLAAGDVLAASNVNTLKDGDKAAVKE